MGTKKEPDIIQARLFSFFESVLRLKSVKRSGWISEEIPDPESVSDHTYSMCAIGMILSDMIGLDTERVIKMVVIHDLAESIIGDYMPGEISKRKKRMEEKNAMACILDQMPATIRPNYRRIWEEYSSNKTRVAKFVHKVDKLEMALQAIQYISEGHSNKKLIRFIEAARLSLERYYDHDDHGRGDTKIILGILTNLEKKEMKSQ